MFMFVQILISPLYSNNYYCTVSWGPPQLFSICSVTTYSTSFDS